MFHRPRLGCIYLKSSHTAIERNSVTTHVFRFADPSSLVALSVYRGPTADLFRLTSAIRKRSSMATPVPDPRNPGGFLMYPPEEFERMISRFRCRRTCHTCRVVCLRLDFGGHGPHGQHGCLINPCPIPMDNPLDIPVCQPCAKVMIRAKSM